MKSKKIKIAFILISLLTLVMFFGVAAICNQCGVAPATTDTTGAEGTTETTDKEKPTSTTDDEGKDEESTEPTSETGKKPTIKLSIYEGPTYAPDSKVCFYRIKAEVTGEPAPTVKFSKDDSLGSLGKNKCQVNINNPSDKYTLTATAKNSAGEVSDSMELKWGCEIPNKDPEITKFETTIAEEKFYINSACSLAADATDPDGDTLTYKWEVSGGTLADAAAKNTTWTMPATAGDYTIKLVVSDGRGGDASDTVTRQVVAVVYNFVDGAPGATWRTNSGVIPFGGPNTDDRGFAMILPSVTLEDGASYSNVLETHPKWIDAGWIEGAFPNSTSQVKIPAGAKFKAKVGFINGAAASNGAYFRLYFYDGASWYRFPDSTGILCAYNGALDDLTFDLSSIAGKSGTIYLGVSTAGSSAQDWAVWVNPVITK